MKNESLKMKVVNPNAAGIDIGSRSHYVSIGQTEDDVREFGVYAVDLKDLVEWLLENGIQTVAMESTGSYWQNLFAILQESGMEVILVNGKFTKNIKGKKTDVMDCMWIQKLHTLGLLSGSFLPDEMTEKLRTYCRHRITLIEASSIAIRRMQKFLHLLNLRLDVVVNDIVGLTGMKILESICQGENDGDKLSDHRHGNCKKSKSEIAKALQSNGREDYLFALKQELAQYKYFQKQIVQCDKEIDNQLKRHLKKSKLTNFEKIPAKVHKRVNKNAPQNLDLNQIAFQYFNGVDLMAIEGVSHSTIIAIMSEVGLEGIKKFESSKQFTSWLRLSPNNKISGGKILSNRIPKGSNRLKIALRNAANAIGNLKDTHLSDFFNRICYRRGRAAAVSATARKLAVIIWNMIMKSEPYNPPTEYEFLDQKRKRKVREMRKLMVKFDIAPTDLGFS
jgi:transposase